MDRSSVTRILRTAVAGEASAADELVPAIYGELRKIADRVLRAQRGPQTLQPTELIHEAWLRLADDSTPAEFEGRVHFQRVAARAMRFVLVDRARARFADKRGGGRRPATLDEHMVAGSAAKIDDLMVVHEGLDRLAAVDQQAAHIVEMRVFGGMTVEETAAALAVSPRTVKRGFRFARAWWLAEMAKEPGDG